MAKKAFALRIDEHILAALQHWADDEFRSVNGQIEYLLRDALIKSGRLKPQAPPPPVTENQD
ncbi:MAG: Arc family DNA binding domain-containing protein [Rheinheimera sp.]|nr:Arc family DNA binding domain-containing protein [Rheinheimera sp.]